MSDLGEIVRDMGELFRTHIAQQNEKIRELSNRLEDLEGHVEHGATGACGVCVLDAPETVGADEYGTDVVTSDFYGDACGLPTCEEIIVPGEEIVQREGKWFHRECAG